MKTLQSLTRVELSPNGDSERYRTANPFPSIVWRDFWDDNFLALVAEEVAAFSRYDGEKDFYGSRKKRYCGDYDKLPARVRELIDFCYSRPFIKYLEDLTGERDLHADPYLEGGGIHSIAPGGFLKIHADYNWHKRLSMYRRLNLLIYLNRGW